MHDLMLKCRGEIEKCAGKDLLFNLRMGYYLSGSAVLQAVLARLDYLLV